MKDRESSKQLGSYWPLGALVSVALLGAFALCFGRDGGGIDWMHNFMGLLFCQFALLKLFDPSGFADGFQMYDLLAKKSRGYALAYPALELFLGLAYLSRAAPLATYLFTLLLMAVGVVGVVKALREGLDVRCACMGTQLDVPLSTVTLTEDLGMGLMALVMLVAGL